MLERARERAALQEIGASRLSWVQADALHMALGERFNLALLTFNTFVHFTEQADQLALLARIAAHLEPGGGLAIDLPNPVEPYRADDVPGLVLERMFTDPATGQVVMQQSLARLDRATQIMTITWIYDRVAPDGQITRTLIPLRIRYNTAGEMRLLLRQSAFGEVEIYGDYDFSSYEEDSPRLLVVAVRDGA
jgi:SAM-dependent methyltransferase